MPSENRNMPKSLILTYISIFAALNALADLIPFTPILGLPESSFRLGWILSPLTGILLGTKMAAVSCLIGGSIEILLGQPLVFGPFTPMRPVISAFVSSMLASRHWRIPAITLSALILVWLLLPVGREAFMILIFHITGLAMILLFREKIGDFTRSKSPKRAVWGLFFAAYCGNISRHLFGNILAAIILNLQSIYFISALPFTLIEQVTFAVGTVILGVSLSRLRLGEFLQPR